MDKTLPVEEMVGPVRVFRLGTGSPKWDKLLLPFRGSLAALRLSQKNSYACFWAMMVTFGSGAAYGCNILRKLSGRDRIPVALTLQEGDSEDHLRYSRGGLISLSWRLALRYTDVLTAISTFLLDRGRRFGYEGRAELIPNGVDVAFFSQQFSEEEKAAFARKLCKKPGEVFLITVSRLARKNAVDDIISSLSYLPEHVSLVVLGKGEEGPKLQAQARELGVAHRVKFLGFLSHADMPRYLSVCDIFIRPSRSEGFGNSFIEAMAARLPVIATPVGGIPDFLDDRETGLFCSPDNPKSIAAAVREVLENNSLRSHIVEQAYARVAERYDWSNMAADFKSKVLDTLSKTS